MTSVTFLSQVYQHTAQLSDLSDQDAGIGAQTCSSASLSLVTAHTPASSRKRRNFSKLSSPYIGPSFRWRKDPMAPWILAMCAILAAPVCTVSSWQAAQRSTQARHGPLAARRTLSGKREFHVAIRTNRVSPSPLSGSAQVRGHHIRG